MAMYEMKKIFNVTNGRLHIVEENINELEEKTIGTIHNESQREKILKKKMNNISVRCEKLHMAQSLSN